MQETEDLELNDDFDDAPPAVQLFEHFRYKADPKQEPMRVKIGNHGNQRQQEKQGTSETTRDIGGNKKQWRQQE